MREVIRWMRTRAVAASSLLYLIDKAFGQMAYADFAVLSEEEAAHRLRNASALEETDIDFLALARLLRQSVVGKVITSLVESGRLLGGAASDLRKLVAQMDAEAVLALTSDDPAVVVLKSALTRGELVDAPFEGSSPVPLVVGATGDRAVAYGDNSGVVATGDGAIVTFNYQRN